VFVATDASMSRRTPRHEDFADLRAGESEEQRGNGARISFEHLMARVAEIPSIFGKLVFFAELACQSRGRAEQQGESPADSTRSKLDRSVYHAHLKIFREWVSLSLQDQLEDLKAHLAHTESWRDIVHAWTQTGCYNVFVPTDASPQEADLFLSDMALLTPLLDLMCHTPESGK
jgi:hypothetical protein